MSVLNTRTDSVTTTVKVQWSPVEVVIRGSRAYVINSGSNSVSVINTATNAVIATVPVGRNPFDMAITPDGSQAYVANTGG
ncbi:MAG: hypothetical protein JO071_12225 [Deltaproteobacteria bacterium]|nr:hypothetical protein [Deltaproteobacteria bacterium]